MYHLGLFVFFPEGIPRLQIDWCLSCDHGLDYAIKCENNNNNTNNNNNKNNNNNNNNNNTNNNSNTWNSPRLRPVSTSKSLSTNDKPSHSFFQAGTRKDNSTKRLEVLHCLTCIQHLSTQKREDLTCLCYNDSARKLDRTLKRHYN